MNRRQKWNANEWYREASQAYVEGHQGCVWCGGSHRVYRNERGTCIEYFCANCEFYAIHDRQQDRYYAAPGIPASIQAPQTE